MKITVKDCLGLNAFNEAKVLAGENSLNDPVRRVTVMEAADPEDAEKYYSSGNQIILTSFFAVRGDEKAQCEIVKAVAGAENTALAIFHVGKVVRSISKKVIETAEEAGMPLIAVSEDRTLEMGDVISEISGKMFYGTDEDFEHSVINNVIFHLLNFEKYSNFPDAAKAAAINNDFQLIILSEDFNPVLSVETRHRTTIAEAIRLGKEREVAKQSDVYTLIEVNGVLTYWGPVTIQGSKYFMFIVDNEDSFSGSDINKLAEIIELAMGMWRYTPERDARAEFIKALRRGNMSLAYSLKDEIGLEPSDIVSVFYGKGIEQGKGKKIMEEFEKDPDLSMIRIAEDDDTYGLIMSTGDDISGKSECIALFNELKGRRDIRIFHVTGLDGIEGACDAYKLIGESWSFVQGVFPYKRVFTKYEMALVSNCINIQLHGGYVKKNYMELLEPFNEMAESKGKQLLDTLETFVLDAGMNSGKTADFMDIHTNTVQYRLKKINDILGAEITGNRVIPGLTIALALKRIERVVS